MSATLDYLRDDALRPWFLTVLATSLVIGGVCAVLSPLVVLRRLGLVGQGVAHSAFGGVGLAALLGLASGGGLGPTGAVLVCAFCVAVAVAIGELTARTPHGADTPIAVFMAGAMALGMLLVYIRREAFPGAPGVSLEAVLFGQILVAGTPELVLAGALGATVGVGLLLARRPLLFWAFDEGVARASGVPTGLMRVLLMAMLGLTVFVATRLAGVVLATALLVLPGATALRCSWRLVPVFVISQVVALTTIGVAFVVSVEADWQTGPTIVLAMTCVFGEAWVAGGRRGGSGGSGEAGGAGAGGPAGV